MLVYFLAWLVTAGDTGLSNAQVHLLTEGLIDEGHAIRDAQGEPLQDQAALIQNALGAVVRGHTSQGDSAVVRDQEEEDEDAPAEDSSFVQEHAEADLDEEVSDEKNGINNALLGMHENGAKSSVVVVMNKGKDEAERVVENQNMESLIQQNTELQNKVETVLEMTKNVANKQDAQIKEEVASHASHHEAIKASADILDRHMSMMELTRDIGGSDLVSELHRSYMTETAAQHKERVREFQRKILDAPVKPANYAPFYGGLALVIVISCALAIHHGYEGPIRGPHGAGGTLIGQKPLVDHHGRNMIKAMTKQFAPLDDDHPVEDHHKDPEWPEPPPKEDPNDHIPEAKDVKAPEKRDDHAAINDLHEKFAELDKLDKQN